MNASRDGAVLIGVDWGTTNVRVIRIGEGGIGLASRTDPRGGGGLGPGDFPRVLADVGAGLIDDRLPILVCGMAGARGRWQEVAYLPEPTGIVDLAKGLVSLDGRPDVRIVPGLKALVDGRMADVLRGEETQVMGLDLGDGDHRIVAPGTHSKWIEARQGIILGHRTFMTGELFAAVRKGTILGADMGEAGTDAEAFVAGVTRALDDPALTAALFSVRVEALADRLKPEAAADFLSGLLIGAEVAAHVEDPRTPVTLVGTSTLNDRYSLALRIAGFSDVRAADGETATARGLWRIHEASL